MAEGQGELDVLEHQSDLAGLNPPQQLSQARNVQRVIEVPAEHLSDHRILLTVVGRFMEFLGATGGPGWPTKQAFHDHFAGGRGGYGNGDCILAKLRPRTGLLSQASGRTPGQGANRGGSARSGVRGRRQSHRGCCLAGGPSIPESSRPGPECRSGRPLDVRRGSRHKSGRCLRERQRRGPEEDEHLVGVGRRLSVLQPQSPRLAFRRQR